MVPCMYVITVNVSCFVRSQTNCVYSPAKATGAETCRRKQAYCIVISVGRASVGFCTKRYHPIARNA
jgi:hypothetical protein